MPRRSPSSGQDHTVHSYDDELDHLTTLIARMGGLAEAQLAGALQALAKRDGALAARVIADDAKVDTLEHEVSAFAVRLLALRQPLANDLRHVVAALKISVDLERMADYATNVAKRALVLNTLPPVPAVTAIAHIGRRVEAMVRETLDAYVARDVDKALRLRNQDEDIDHAYTGLVRELITYMMEDARNITACTHLLFVAKNIERVGDHVTNVAEIIYFLVKGTPLGGERPKGSSASHDPVTPPDGDGR